MRWGWHNIYTMTIARYSEMSETGNTRLLSRSGLFKPSAERIKEFNDSVNLIFDEKGALKALNNLHRSLYLYNRVMLLELLYYGLILTSEPKYIEYYKQQYGKAPEKETDYKRILSDIKRNSSHLKVLQKQSEAKGDEKDGNFELVIASVEVVLGFNISRDIKLFQFKQNYDLAIKKIQTNG